jgi:hypothetical protein
VRTKLANKPDEQKQALPAPTFLAEQDDTALVTAAESGSNEAFEVLVRRHQARPLRVAWRFTRNLEDAGRHYLLAQLLSETSKACTIRV